MRMEQATVDVSDVTFCHPWVRTLVRHGQLDKTVGLQLTLADFNDSALSERLVFNLVYDGIVPASAALQLTKVSYQSSALSYIPIYMLVAEGSMPYETALAMDRREVASPVEFFQSLPELSEMQRRKLALYEAYPDLNASYVERIIIFEFCGRRLHPCEQREYALLLDPELRPYAQKIAMLEFVLPKTPENERWLSLLLDPYAREYAKEIVALENTKTKTVQDEEKLEALYLRVCCQLPRPTIAQVALRSYLGEQGEDVDGTMAAGCGHSSRQVNVAALFHMPLGISQSACDKLMAKMKRLFISSIKPVINAHLEAQGVNTKQREAKPIADYIEQKEDFLLSCLLKYFVGNPKHSFSKAALDDVIGRLCEEIVQRKLSLHQTEKLTTLSSWINEQQPVALKNSA